MQTFRFLDFEVYKDAKRFYKLAVKTRKRFPREFYSLSDQLMRSALSVILNIAEGSAKRSDKDFNKYIEIALGSINESISVFDVARENNLISAEDFEEAYKLAENIAKQLGGFSKKLRNTVKG